MSLRDELEESGLPYRVVSALTTWGKFRSVDEVRTWAASAYPEKKRGIGPWMLAHVRAILCEPPASSVSAEDASAEIAVLEAQMAKDRKVVRDTQERVRAARRRIDKLNNILLQASIREQEDTGEERVSAYFDAIRAAIRSGTLRKNSLAEISRASGVPYESIRLMFHDGNWDATVIMRLLSYKMSVEREPSKQLKILIDRNNRRTDARIDEMARRHEEKEAGWRRRHIEILERESPDLAIAAAEEDRSLSQIDARDIHWPQKYESGPLSRTHNPWKCWCGYRGECGRHRGKTRGTPEPLSGRWFRSDVRERPYGLKPIEITEGV